MSTKKAGWLIDYNGDQFIPMTSAFEIFNRHGARTFGNAEANDDNLGAQNQFIFINNGVFAPSTQSIGTDEKTLMYLNNGVFSRSTKSEGSKINPIYLSGGTLVASDETVGSATKLMYLSNGTFTESKGNVGSGTRPIYLSGGVLTACNTNIGANDNFIYIDSDGSLTPSTENKGGDYTPLYLRQGKLVAGNNLNYTLSLGDLSNNCIAFQLLRNGNIQTGLGFLGTTNIVLKKDSSGNVIEISAGYQEAEYKSGLQISVGFYDDEDLHVPYASDSQYGVVKTGYTTSGRNFAVQLSDGKMYVNVPSDNVDSYHTPTTPEVVEGKGLKIATGTGVGDLYVPIWARTNSGYAPGLVPYPGTVATGDKRFLGADGQWKVPANDCVKQSAHSPSDAEYSILTKWNTEAKQEDGETAIAGYDSDCTINPSKGRITASQLKTNVFYAPTSSGGTTYGVGTVGKVLKSNGATIYWGTDSNTTYSTMSGATSSTAGTSGLVPQPAAGANKRFLRGDGTWVLTNTVKQNSVTENADRPILTKVSNTANPTEEVNYSLQCCVNHSTNTIKASAFNATSDARLKENLRPFVHKNILDLPIYTFDFINGTKNRVGCMAQDLQIICPEIVHVDSNGYLSIEESKIVYLLLDKMKEMQKEIDELRGV